MRRVLACIASMGLVLCAAGCAGTLDLFLLHPSHDHIATMAQRVTVAVEDPALPELKTTECFYQAFGPADRPVDYYVLALTGNAGRAEIMPEWTRRNCGEWLKPDSRIAGESGPRRIGVLALQYPGYGADHGPFGLKRCAAAACAAYQYLDAQAGDAPVVVYGLSAGTCFALHVARTFATRSPPAALIIEKPPSIRSQILWQHGWWNLWLVALPLALSVPTCVRSDLHAKHSESVPALFILADDDRVVPVSYQRAIATSYVGPKQIVKVDVTHNELIDCRIPAVRAGYDWLRTRLDERRTE